MRVGFMGLGTVINVVTVIVGALVGSIGTAVLAVLVMRAMGEWKTIRERDERLPKP